jgi:spore germination cell wall hydrolase CwlJ-like protein
MRRDELQEFRRLDDRQILALTLYGEARGESAEGKIAVGSVILERVDHRAWDGKTIQEVCLKKYQFSCFNAGDPNLGKLTAIAENWDAAMATDPALNDCYGIACGLIDGRIPRTPEIAAAHCCQYLTPAARKSADWWKSMNMVARVGGHEFYA